MAINESLIKQRVPFINKTPLNEADSESKSVALIMVPSEYFGMIVTTGYGIVSYILPKD